MEGMTMHTGRKFRQVENLELLNIRAPQATRTWCPIEHGWLLMTTLDALQERGFELSGQPDLRVNADNTEFFGMLPIAIPGSSWGLNVGLRNTNNKRASAAVLLGQRVWMCDNLSFSADHTLVRKHHPQSHEFLMNGIREIMSNLPQYVQERQASEERMRRFYPAPEVVSDVLVKAARNGAILIGDILKIADEFNSPSEDNPESIERSAWGLYNAATFVGREYFLRNPDTAAQRSIALTKLFEEVTP